MWIDIEGFSEFYDEDRAPSLLSDLALDLYKIGCGYGNGYVGDEFRERKAIFVHQFGDGFILGSFYEPALDRPMAIAIAALRSTALRGGFARAAISFGELAGVAGCHHKEIREQVDKEGETFTLGFGPGKMSISPVMGEGLIRANKLSSDRRMPRGPQLLVDARIESMLNGIQGKWDELFRDKNGIAIDWIRAEIPLADQILDGIKERKPSPNVLVGALQLYMAHNELCDSWKEGAELLIRGAQ